MLEDFAGNSFETATSLNLTPSHQTFTSSFSPLDTRDYYSSTLGAASSLNLPLSGLSANTDTIPESLLTTLDAGTSYIQVHSGAETTNPYNLSLSTTPNPVTALSQTGDILTGFGNPKFDTGVFTVGSSGQVSIDYLLDGGLYQGELAIFSLEGMDQFDLGSDAFFQEAARRALSDSQLGHVVISDAQEGARFHGSFPGEGDFNFGDYQGAKTFSMRPGDEFGVMLVPDGKVQQVFDNPTLGGDVRPLFSLATANPNDAFHVGQIADVTGDGNTFVMEDLRVDGWTDKDYNDFLFQVKGAVGNAVRLDELIDTTKDWRNTELGRDLVQYVELAREQVALNNGLNQTANGFTSEISNVLEEFDTQLQQVIANPNIQLGEINPELDQTTVQFFSDLDSAVEQATVQLEAETGKVLPDVNATVGQFEFPRENQPLVGMIDTGFAANNPDIDYSRISLGKDQVEGDNNPLLAVSEGNEHGTHILGIIGATQNNGIGIDGVNDDAPLWVGRAVGSGKWAESLVEFVDAAKTSGQRNAVVNLSFDLTQTNPDGSVTTRYEFTPSERVALEYARDNGVLIVAAAGNEGTTMSALGQASREFDNIITVGSVDSNGTRADYSSFGEGLDLMAVGGTPNDPVISTVGSGTATQIQELDFFKDLTAEEKIAFEQALQAAQLPKQGNTQPLNTLDQGTLTLIEAAQKVLQTAINALEDSSNSGENSAPTGLEVDTLLAPGEVADISTPTSPGIGGMAGTSVAAAKVTGAAAQIWAANPDLSFAQVKEILKATAIDLNTPGWDAETGVGLLNLAAALQMALIATPEPYTPGSGSNTPSAEWSGEEGAIPGEREAGKFWRGVKKVAKTIFNNAKNIVNTVGNAFIKVGKFLPKVQNVFNWLGGRISGGLGNIFFKVANFLGKATPIFGKIGTFLVSKAAPFVGAAVTVIKGVVSFVKLISNIFQKKKESENPVPLPPPPIQTVVADSVSAFSNVQGQNNWYYGYYDGPFNSSDFQPMTQFINGRWWRQNGTYWTSLDAAGGHPNSVNTSAGRARVDNWSVRRWVSSVDGEVTIAGNLAKTNTRGGDGVIGQIFADSVLLWSGTVGGTDGIGINYTTNPIKVRLGSFIDFVIAPGRNDASDDASFTGTIFT